MYNRHREKLRGVFFFPDTPTYEEVTTIKTKELNYYPRVSKLLGSYVGYAHMMTLCIISMLSAWLLIIAASILQLILMPRNMTAWTLLVIFAVLLILSRKPYAMYREIYRSHMTPEEADTYEKDLSVCGIAIKPSSPAVITKTFLYIPYRCDIIRIPLNEITGIRRRVDYSKKRFKPIEALVVTTTDDTEHVIPFQSIHPENIGVFANELSMAVNACTKPEATV